MKLSRQLDSFLNVSIWLFFLLVTGLNPLCAQTNEFVQRAEYWKYSQVDSALYYAEKGLELGRVEKDTFSYLKALEVKLYIAHYIDNHSDIYDLHWEILSIADSSKYPEIVAKVYSTLGIFYDVYNQSEQAEQYIEQSVELMEQLVDRNEIQRDELVNCYFNAAIHYKMQRDYNKALGYLKKSRFQSKLLATSSINDPFAFGQMGAIYFHKGLLDSAKYYLYQSLDGFSTAKTPPPFIYEVYLSLGNVYFEENNTERAEEYYLLALRQENKAKSVGHVNRNVYENLALFYKKKHNYKKAHYYLEKYKLLNDSLFGIMSLHNNKIFAVRDKFREEKNNKELLLSQQKVVLLEQDQKIVRLRVWVFSMIGVLIVGGLVLFLKVQQKRKDSIIARNQEILEIKNKELTQSSLKIIEHDEQLQSLKKQLEEAVAADDVHKVLKAVIRRIKVNVKHNWDEFDLRFSAINQDFFDRLQKKYPHLTHNELRICAMVKLNLAGKDMACLLGISLKSVHTARYRLRKKLNLDNEVNLQQFISSI